MTVAKTGVQTALRDFFAQWGLPQTVRVDHGRPWGSWGDLPPALALWVLGLDVAMLWNRPRHSQGHAVVERAHGVCQRWVEPATCPDAATLQGRLDWATTVQREAYPAIAGQSRVAAYPTLAGGGRPYDPAQEEGQWDEQRVWAALADGVWSRRVDKVGRISLDHRAVSVGRPHAGTTVTVQLVVRDAAPPWRIRAADGTLLREEPAPELRRERIIALDVSHPRPSRARTQPHGQ